ncbi:MAG: hypothetical protein JWQ71_4638 [Pedosphaera sp.]|nr:hypothetical protein [Pedosphaera sp.]
MNQQSNLNLSASSALFLVKAIRFALSSLLLIVLLSLCVSPSKADLFALQRQSPQLMRFNEASHTLAGTSYSPDSSESFDGMAFGPDGNLYVVDNILGDGRVLRFNGQTGAFIDVFIYPSSNQRIYSPHAVTFGPDGQLYIGVSTTNNEGSLIVRYDGKTGVYLNTFVLPGAGGLGQVSDMAFGNDGNLYVVDSSKGVLQYSGVDGHFLSVFAVCPTNVYPRNLAFGPSGDLFLTTTANSVLRFNGANGTLLGTFIPPGSGGLTSPAGLAFDAASSLCVSSTGSRSVLRYNGNTGAFMDSFQLPSGPPSSRGPTFLAITPVPPQLKIQRSGSNLVLSWPRLGANFSLQASSDFSPTCHWTTVTNTPVLVGNVNTVTVGIVSAARLYRLMR